MKFLSKFFLFSLISCLLFLFLSASVISGANLTVNSTSNSSSTKLSYKLFNARIGSFQISFLYPSSWGYQPSGNYIHVFSPDRRTVITITLVEDPNLNNMKLDDFSGPLLQELKATISNLKVEGKRRAVLVARPAMYLQFSGTLRDKPIWGFELWSIEGSYAIVVQLLSRVSDRRSLEPIVDTLVSSLYIRGPAFNYQWFKDINNGFKVSYPANWEQRTIVKGNVMGVKFISPPDGANDDIRETFQVKVMKVKTSSDLSSDFKEFEAEYVTYMSKQYDNFKLLKREEVLIGGIKGVQITFYGEIKGIKIVKIASWTFKGEKAYLLEFTTTLDKYYFYKPIAEKMMESFQFIGM